MGEPAARPRREFASIYLPMVERMDALERSVMIMEQEQKEQKVRQQDVQEEEREEDEGLFIFGGDVVGA